MNMMPKENVLNIIEFTGKQDMIDKFKKDIESSTTIVDFNKIQPVPDELIIHKDNISDYKTDIVSSFDLFVFDSLVSQYIKLGIFDIMNEKDCTNSLDVFGYIREKYLNREEGDYRRKVSTVFYRFLIQTYSTFFKEFNKLLDSNPNIDELIKTIRSDVNNIKRIEIDDSILRKYGLDDKDYYTAVGLFCLILLNNYNVLTDKDFRVLYWGCSSNSINPYWVNNTLIFNTNNRPSPIFERICKKYSDLGIKIYYIFLNQENNKIEDGECNIRIIENDKGETKRHTILADDPENKEVVKYLNNILSHK